MPKRKPKPTQLTTKTVAMMLGVTTRRVRALAEARNVGQKLGRDWLFTRADVESLRPGPPGNPNLRRNA